ncbi:MAG: linear amide C-N hydrolase [Thermodesulfobacteriota bacterium]
MRQKPRALWAFLLTTSVIFTVWATSAPACTGIVLEGEDDTTVYGRTMEWSGFDFKTQAAVYPRNTSFQGVTPEGENGMSWKGKYGFLGFLLLDRVIGDGMNEKGLAAGEFYHEGFAEYTEYDPDLSDHSMASTDVLPYILSNFATVEEVRQGMQRVRVVPVQDPSIGKVPPVHFFVADPSGKSLVIEYLDGKPTFYDNPVGVITNNPTFDWHLQNLRNYGNLSIDSFEKKTWGELEITPLASGSGLLGLPGDYTSPSRFVRAVMLKQTSFPTQGGMDTVNQFFRIMDSFNVPASQGEGHRSAEAKKNRLPSDTQWTIASDTKNLVTYYHTAWNRQVRKIDLKEIDFTKSGVRKTPLDQERIQSVKDRTESLH